MLSMLMTETAVFLIFYSARMLGFIFGRSVVSVFASRTFQCNY